LNHFSHPTDFYEKCQVFCFEKCADSKKLTFRHRVFAFDFEKTRQKIATKLIDFKI